MASQSLNIGVLGSGNIGRNAAIHFLKAGHTVYLANSRGPESLREAVAELGAGARAATVADAVGRAEIVLIAVPWLAKEKTIDSAGGAGVFAGKIVIDAMNPYTEYPATEDLGGRTSSEIVASLLSPTARVVKAFNTIYFQTLADAARPGAPLDQLRSGRYGQPRGRRLTGTGAAILQQGFHATGVACGTRANRSRRGVRFRGGFYG